MNIPLLTSFQLSFFTHFQQFTFTFTNKQPGDRICLTRSKLLTSLQLLIWNVCTGLWISPEFQRKKSDRKCSIFARDPVILEIYFFLKIFSWCKIELDFCQKQVQPLVGHGKTYPPSLKKQMRAPEKNECFGKMCFFLLEIRLETYQPSNEKPKKIALALRTVHY